MAYSIQTAVSDGTLEVLDLSIKYMDKGHIFVYVDDVLADGSAYNYIWLTDTRIQIIPAVASGSTLKVIRKTLTDEMWHEFSQGARFSTTSMDENFEQLLFLAQEYSEGVYIADFYTDVDFHLHRIMNLGDAINDRDAVNLKVLKEYLPNANLLPPIVTRLDELEATKVAKLDLASSMGASSVGIGQTNVKSLLDALPVPVKQYSGAGIDQIQGAVLACDGYVAINEGETDLTTVGGYAKLNRGKLIGYGGTLRTTELASSVLVFEEEEARVAHPASIGITYRQPDSFVSGGGTLNNHACLVFNAADYPIAMGNIFPSVDIGMKFHYGDVLLPERGSKYGLAAFNSVAGARVMGIENHGGSMCRTVGNVIVGADSGGRSHGLRITGLNSGSTVYPAECNSAASNVVANMLTAASFQTTARHNIYSALAFKALAGSNSTALQFTAVASTLPTSYVQKGNVISISGIGADYGVYNDGAELNDITLALGDTMVRGVYADKSANTHGTAGGNNYRGVIRNFKQRGIDLRADTAGYDQLDLQLYGWEADRTLATLGANIASSNNTGKLHIRHTNTGLTISGNYNTFDVQISDIASNFALNISGTGNTIRGYVNGTVTLTGPNNTVDANVIGAVTVTGAGAQGNRFRGTILGTITQSGGAGGTDIELLTDASNGKRGKDKRTISVTTDASGNATFNHNLMDIGGSKFVQCTALGAYNVQTTNITNTTATVTVRSASTGAVAPNTTVTLYVDGVAFFN